MSRIANAWKKAHEAESQHVLKREIRPKRDRERTTQSCADDDSTPSPAAQCIVDPSTCRHLTDTYCSCIP